MNTDDDTNARTSSSSMNTDNGEGDEFEQDSTTTTTDTTTTSSTSSSSSAAASDTKLKTNTRGATSSDSNSFGMNADFTQNGDSVPQPSDWIQENYNLSDADFQHLLDIENNTDDWDHATCKNGVDIWKQQNEGSSLYLIKGCGILPDIDPVTAWEAVCNTPVRLKWDQYVRESREVDRLDAFNLVMYYAYKSPSMVYDRDFLQCRSTKFDYPDEGDIMVLYRSIPHPDCPDRSGEKFVRAETEISAQIFRQCEEGTELTIFSQNDLKGDIPKFIINMVSAQAPVTWYGSLENGCNQLQEDPQSMRETAGNKIDRMARERMEVFTEVFELTEDETGNVVADVECYYEDGFGKMYISEKHICWHSEDRQVRHIIGIHQVEKIAKKTTGWIFPNAIQILHEEGEHQYKDFVGIGRDTVHDLIIGVLSSNDDFE
eukprot:TRINITY_DN447_c0_g1_i1.p1 TRINITY_DN447_c0_g1~~TRINITY_DN447_c0_g1_i1.p1  ORF type:complete len:469 (+),score=97.03 TRINITY_DN447_c0_g1_i1:116-1408(+)